jgi:hypothetical protein
MRDMQVSAGEAVVRLLERGSPGIIARFGAEPDLVKILQHPTTSIACDCGAVAGDASHPRYYGTFPRVLGRYVREQQVLTWEDAVRKMTGLPAATIGLVDRGLLAAGMAADVSVFDPRTVADHATFEDPMRPSEGIRFVLINGHIAVSDGKPTGEHPGRALFRSDRMPTRPMNAADRRLIVRGGPADDPAAGAARLEIDVAQEGKAPRATGVVRLINPGAGVAMEMTDLGVLQTFGDWATLTGRARLRPADPERSVTIIIDGSTLIVDAGDYTATFIRT